MAKIKHKKKKSPKLGRAERRYTITEKGTAMGLYAAGYGYTAIAQIMGFKDRNVVRRWREARKPMDWDEFKDKVGERQATEVEKSTMKTILESQVLYQTRLHQLLDAVSYQMVSKANNKQMDDGIAAKSFFKAIEEGLKMHIPVMDRYMARPGMVQGPQAAFAFNQKPSGEIGVLATLNQMFENSNAGRIAAKSRDNDDSDSDL